ncbi:MAG: hypothetical protein ABIJ56_08825 [Pseudomonadota bacterium]
MKILQAAVIACAAFSWVLPGCTSSNSLTGDAGSDQGRDDPVPEAQDVADAVDVGADAEAVDATADDAALDDAMEDMDPACRPQEAGEDPDIDCDGCDPCDPTPYQWTGSRCEFLPICCSCIGADCGNRFSTFTACMEAYRSCPATTVLAEYPEARLLWAAPGGFVGAGPMILMDGSGLARVWEFDQGLYTVDSEHWGRTDWDFSEELGVEAANDLFGHLLDVDYSDLPHPPDHWLECYPVFEFRTCGSCTATRLDYQSAGDLVHEFDIIYNWFDWRLCRLAPYNLLPRSFCEFDY